MDVRIGQGGQAGFDILNKNNDCGQSVPNTTNKMTVEAVNTNQNIDKKDSTIKEEDVKKAVEKLNKFLEDEKTHAEYEVHDKFKDIMIKIVDDKTNEVVMEVPPKKILDMIAKMCEMVGVLVDKKA